MTAAPFPLVTQITDATTLGPAVVLERMARATAPLLVQVRDKALPPGERRTLALEIRDAARPLGHFVIMNGDLEIAVELGLDGVHLPAALASSIDAARAAIGPSRLVTVACHDIVEVERAAERGADAVLLSPIFATPGKGPVLGLEALERARAVLDRQAAASRLVALGGVDPSNASSALRAGADGVAVIRADLTAWLRGSTLR